MTPGRHNAEFDDSDRLGDVISNDFVNDEMPSADPVSEVDDSMDDPFFRFDYDAMGAPTETNIVDVVETNSFKGISTANEEENPLETVKIPDSNEAISNLIAVNKPTDVNVLDESVQANRPLAIYLNSNPIQKQLNEICSHTFPLFIQEIANNPWRLEFHLSQYTPIHESGKWGYKKIVQKETITREPPFIRKLIDSSLTRSSMMCVGMNLSNKGGYGSTELDIIIMDLDPPENSVDGFHALEGKIVQLLFEYFNVDKMQHPMSAESLKRMVIPWIIKTPRGLHLIFRYCYSVNEKNRLTRNKRLSSLGFAAEYIRQGNINVIGGPYQTILCPSSLANLAALPDFLMYEKVLTVLPNADSIVINDFIKEGSRNTQLFNTLRNTKHRSIHTAELINKYFCKPPLSNEECVRILGSVNKQTSESPQNESETTAVEMLVNIKSLKQMVAAKFNLDVTPDTIDRFQPMPYQICACAFGSNDRATLKTIIKFYLEFFSSDYGAFQLIADLFLGLWGANTETKVLILSKNNTTFYKAYEAENGIWVDLQEAALHLMIHDFIKRAGLGKYNNPKDLQNVFKMVKLSATKSELPFVNGIQGFNGFLSYDTCKLLPKSQKNYAQSLLEVNFNEDLTLDKAVANFFLQISNSSTAQLNFLRIFLFLAFKCKKNFSYGLTLQGPPGSGKTVLLNFLGKAFPSVCQAVTFVMLNGDFAFQNLKNKFIITCGEVPTKPSSASLNTIKSLLGGDKVSYRNIFSSLLTSITGMEMFFACNEKWSLGEEVVPFFRRMIYIETSTIARHKQKQHFELMFDRREVDPYMLHVSYMGVFGMCWVSKF